MILQIGVAPIRVDILMDIEGVSSQLAWKNRVKSHYGRARIWILEKNDLIETKKKAGRPQDQLDLKKLITRRKI